MSMPNSITLDDVANEVYRQLRARQGPLYEACQDPAWLPPVLLAALSKAVERIRAEDEAMREARAALMRLEEGWDRLKFYYEPPKPHS